MYRINLFVNRRSLESRVLDLLREKQGMFASNCVCAFLRWDVVRVLNRLHESGAVRFYAAMASPASRIWWRTPLVVLADVPPDPIWRRVNRRVEGIDGTIGQVRFARGMRNRRATKERHGR